MLLAVWSSDYVVRSVANILGAVPGNTVRYREQRNGSLAIVQTGRHRVTSATFALRNFRKSDVPCRATNNGDFPDWFWFGVGPHRSDSELRGSIARWRLRGTIRCPLS